MRVCSSQPKVVVRAEQRGVFSIHGQTRLRRCTPGSVYRLIADCGSHVRWIPGLKSVLVHPTSTADGQLILDEVHEITFLAFGKSFNTRLSMKADPSLHRVSFNLLSSNLYQHYTTTFTTHEDGNPAAAAAAGTGSTRSTTMGATGTGAHSGASRAGPRGSLPSSVESPAMADHPCAEGSPYLDLGGLGGGLGGVPGDGDDLGCDLGDGLRPVDLDNATTVVRLEGSLAFQVAPPGPFRDMLRESLETELLTTLANMEKELLRRRL